MSGLFLQFTDCLHVIYIIILAEIECWFCLLVKSWLFKFLCCKFYWKKKVDHAYLSKKQQSSIPQKVNNWFHFQSSGVEVKEECKSVFEEIKIGHKYSYIIYKISADMKCIEVDCLGKLGKFYMVYVDRVVVLVNYLTI